MLRVYSHFHFCSHFESNVAFSLEESHTDVAAVRLYRVRLTLSGTTFFYNNSGGGLDITQGQVDVVAMVTFEGNTAILGAAMRLFGQTEVSTDTPRHLSLVALCLSSMAILQVICTYIIW